jgi:hypothetical protein
MNEKMEQSLSPIRAKELWMLKINDVFGPPIGVKNEVFAEFRKLVKEHGVPDITHSDEWVVKQFVDRGYKHIPANRAFSYTLEGGYVKVDPEIAAKAPRAVRAPRKIWANEFKLVGA